MPKHNKCLEMNFPDKMIAMDFVQNHFDIVHVSETRYWITAITTAGESWFIDLDMTTDSLYTDTASIRINTKHKDQYLIAHLMKTNSSEDIVRCLAKAVEKVDQGGMLCRDSEGFIRLHKRPRYIKNTRDAIVSMYNIDAYDDIAIGFANLVCAIGGRISVVYCNGTLGECARGRTASGILDEFKINDLGLIADFVEHEVGFAPAMIKVLLHDLLIPVVTASQKQCSHLLDDEFYI